MIIQLSQSNWNLRHCHSLTPPGAVPCGVIPGSMVEWAATPAGGARDPSLSKPTNRSWHGTGCWPDIATRKLHPHWRLGSSTPLPPGWGKESECSSCPIPPALNACNCHSPCGLAFIHPRRTTAICSAASALCATHAHWWRWHPSTRVRIPRSRWARGVCKWWSSSTWCKVLTHELDNGVRVQVTRI